MSNSLDTYDGAQISVIARKLSIASGVALSKPTFCRASAMPLRKPAFPMSSAVIKLEACEEAVWFSTFRIAVGGVIFCRFVGGSSSSVPADRFRDSDAGAGAGASGVVIVIVAVAVAGAVDVGTPSSTGAGDTEEGMLGMLSVKRCKVLHVEDCCVDCTLTAFGCSNLKVSSLHCE